MCSVPPGRTAGTLCFRVVCPSLNDFEETHVYTYRLQPLLWVRYIDDIFMLWQRGPTELTSFVQHLNSCHLIFKFTCDQSLTKVNFLDTTVCKTPQGTLYTKPNDAHMYLHFTSSHPKHCKTSLPYSQFLRIQRICTLESDFDHHANNMKCRYCQKLGSHLPSKPPRLQN